MFRYRLHSPDGDDLGEATYALMIKPGEEILVGALNHDPEKCVPDQWERQLTFADRDKCANRSAQGARPV